MDRSPRQRISKETVYLNNTIDQMDFADIHITLHSTAAEYTFFSSEYGTFSRMDHMLGQKVSLNKFRKIEIIFSLFSDHNSMKLEIT